MTDSSGRLGGVLSGWRAAPARAAIFDFNGTLSDDEPILLRLFQDLFREEVGWEMSQDYYEEHLLGLSDRDIFRTALEGRLPGDVDPHVQRLLRVRTDRYLAEAERSSPIRDATVALVHALAGEAGTRLGVVTGAVRAEVDPVLRWRDLDRLFDVVVTEDDVRAGKPDPEGYLRAADLLGLDPGDCLVFEDSVAGVRAARSAGMEVVAVGTERTEPALSAEGVPVVRELSPELLG